MMASTFQSGQLRLHKKTMNEKSYEHRFPYGNGECFIARLLVKVI